MPPDPDLLITLVILALGPAMYLRLTAKEKRRREKHLEARLEEKVKELRAEAERLEAEAGETADSQATAERDEQPAGVQSDGGAAAASHRPREQMAATR